MVRGARGRVSRQNYLARRRGWDMEQRGNDQPWWSGNASRGYWAWHEFAPDSPSATAAPGKGDGAQEGPTGDEQGQQVLDGFDDAGIEEDAVHDGVSGQAAEPADEQLGNEGDFDDGTARWVNSLIHTALLEAAAPLSPQVPLPRPSPKPKAPAPIMVKYKAIPPAGRRHLVDGRFPEVGAPPSGPSPPPPRPSAANHVEQAHEVRPIAPSTASVRLPQFASRGPILLNDESAELARRDRELMAVQAGTDFPPRPPLGEFAPATTAKAAPRQPSRPPPRRLGVADRTGQRRRSASSRHVGRGERREHGGRRDRRARSSSRRRSRSRGHRRHSLSRFSRGELVEALARAMQRRRRRR